MEFSRFLTERAFATELTKLRAYGSNVYNNLLESLEQEGLVVPRLRLRYPDPVARRAWVESREGYVLKLPIEPDGERWNAAVDLMNAIHRWRNLRAYGLTPHPLDDVAERFAPFVQNPAQQPFESQKDRRVDVGNNHHDVLFDHPADDTFYSTWQLLLAAEVADAGIHIRVDLSNPATLEAVRKALDEERLPAQGYILHLAPVSVTREFRRHANALDAVIWSGEEADRAFNYLLRNAGGGRFRLTDEQVLHRGLNQAKAAKDAAARYQVDGEALIAALKFLAGRWDHWEKEGRSLIAGAYKEVMGEAVRTLQRAFEMDYADIKTRVGHPGGWHEPILARIWPDWKVEQQDRVRLTLKSAIGAHDITAEEIDAFAEFLSLKNLEAFFWHLKSFEDHAFRGNEFAVEGMQAHLQGMAVAVEHVAEALGGTKAQLYDKFKELWRDPTVLALLKRDDISRYARQAALAQDWPALRASIEALRQVPGGDIAADLVLAHRIRGGVHTLLPEDDQLQLEFLLVALMRAAVMTFVEVQRGQVQSPVAAVTV